MKKQARTLGIAAVVAVLITGVANVVIGLFVVFAVSLTGAMIQGLAGLDNPGVIHGDAVCSTLFIPPLMAVIAAVLGLIGVSGLKKGGKRSWVLLAAAGALCLVAAAIIFRISSAGWVYAVDAVLFLAGGILAAARKKEAGM